VQDVRRGVRQEGPVVSEDLGSGFSSPPGRRFGAACRAAGPVSAHTYRYEAARHRVAPGITLRILPDIVDQPGKAEGALDIRDQPQLAGDDGAEVAYPGGVPCRDWVAHLDEGSCCEEQRFLAGSVQWFV